MNPIRSLAVVAAAATLAACGSNVPLNNQAQMSYPAPAVAGQPAAVGTAPAAVEMGRITDIQVAQPTAATAGPNVGRAVAGGIIGAVVGNVIGKNIDNGHSRSGATVLGGAAGAAIGSGVGRNTAPAAGTQQMAYRVTVQTDQGLLRTYEVGALGDLRVGDRVRVDNGVIYRS